MLTKDLDALEHEVRCRGCNVPLTQDPIRSVLTGMVTGSLEVDTLHQFNIQAKVL